MREIKFRAYLKLDNGLSRCDPSFCEKDVMVSVNSIHMDEDGVQDITVVDDYFGDGELVDLVFDPDTMGLMQFTGLHDRNGVEIYEGDIIKFGKISLIVEWSEKISSFMGRPNGKLRDWPSLTEHSAAKHGVILGNIYENNELLEAER